MKIAPRDELKIKQLSVAEIANMKRKRGLKSHQKLGRLDWIATKAIVRQKFKQWKARQW